MCDPLLAVFERDHPDDRRPRGALAAAWAFIDGAPRGRLQRRASMEAHRAAASASSEAARLAAQAAGDAASAAYLHPIAAAHQVGHILRAAANAARIAELEDGGNTDAARESLERARANATPELVNVLRRYPPAVAGRSRSAELLRTLDTILRTAG